MTGAAETAPAEPRRFSNVHHGLDDWRRSQMMTTTAAGSDRESNANRPPFLDDPLFARKLKILQEYRL